MEQTNDLFALALMEEKIALLKDLYLRIKEPSPEAHTDKVKRIFHEAVEDLEARQKKYRGLRAPMFYRSPSGSWQMNQQIPYKDATDEEKKRWASYNQAYIFRGHRISFNPSNPTT